MGGDDPVGDESDARAIVSAVPGTTRSEAADFDCSVVLGVCKGLVVTVTPAKASEYTDIRSNCLLEIQTEAVLVPPLVARCGNVRGRRSRPGKIFFNGLAITSHIRVVQIAEESDGAGATEQAGTGGVEFQILGTGTG